MRNLRMGPNPPGATGVPGNEAPLAEMTPPRRMSSAPMTVPAVGVWNRRSNATATVLVAVGRWVTRLDLASFRNAGERRLEIAAEDHVLTDRFEAELAVDRA